MSNSLIRLWYNNDLLFVERNVRFSVGIILNTECLQHAFVPVYIQLTITMLHFDRIGNLCLDYDFL